MIVLQCASSQMLLLKIREVREESKGILLWNLYIFGPLKWSYVLFDLLKFPQEQLRPFLEGLLCGPKGAITSMLL